jgi:NTP pyrophosphatase (non-canonical NTP hydrolase)
MKARKRGGAAGGEIAAVIAAIKKFRDARDWEKFHDAKNLALCLNVEAAELLEVFLWREAEEVDPARLKDELADVFYSAFLLADKFGWDVGKIVRDKLRKNAVKYPVRKAKGSRKKYDEL